MKNTYKEFKSQNAKTPRDQAQTINAACCLLLIFAIFTAQNLNAQDINPEVKVLSVLGEPLITNIIFASEVKTAKLEAIDPEKFTASDFAIRDLCITPPPNMDKC